MPALVEFNNASLGYGRKVVLKGITFTIEAGEFFGIVGPNGSGKTTILRAILGIVKPLEGAVRTTSASGEPLHIGYVPQRDAIDDVLPYSVEEVVLMGRCRRMGLLRRPGKKDYDIVRRSIAHVGMEDLAQRVYKDLSGGQRQRVLIARALASEPEMLVLDEPTNGMDLPSRFSILDLAHDLHANASLTVVMVSHLLDDVANRVQRIAIVDREFFQVGAVDAVLTAKNLTTLYGMPVCVEQAHGKTIILPGGHDGLQ